MNKKKVNKALKKTPIDQPVKLGFFRRFTMVFESIFIVTTTVALIYSTSFFDLPAMIIELSTHQDKWNLTELGTAIGISIVGLLFLFVRYSLHLRKSMKQQLTTVDEIKKLAFYDRLTHLPNQALCYDRLEHALEKATINNTSVAALFIGIDDFKSVNTQKGHKSGDKLLQEIARRLSNELRPGDTLARVTGVEFLIILESLQPEDDITAIADKLLVKLVKNYRIDMQDIFITGNIGIAVYPTDGEHSNELVNHADMAMCFAKEQGKNRLAFFSKELQEKVNAKKKMIEQLQGALEKEELILHYQPIIAANTHEIIGVEALLRWHNKQLGEMAPDVFIPIAEEMGIIAKIGDWVLTQACQQNKAWQEQGLTNIVMSINLSVMQLQLKNYALTVGASLAASQLEPQYLELDFTENTLMKDVRQSLKQLKQLSELGVTIALDDFGTGYSSMQYLPKFYLNKIKIDRHFIKKLPTSTTDARTILAITALAKQLKLQITAEGVETKEQCQFIEKCKIDSMQGYYFSKPLDAEEVTELLQSPAWQQNQAS